ncbi:MAG TPA: hypothetical protein VL400_10200 [Polyangiaceae bacterium]|nr:hypothetical protein [Polyangiaceae bacterium]
MFHRHPIFGLHRFQRVDVEPLHLARWPVVASVAVALAACGDAGTDSGSGGGSTGGAAPCTVDESYDPPIDPASFVEGVDNPLFPLVTGTVFHYVEGTASVDVTVMAETKTILGVTCTQVHDVLTDGGEVVEDTLDWYAQDTDGTVWYFGEDTKEYSGGMVVSTEGSWTAGVDGAKPGILVEGSPAVGDQYRQEYYACHAEDMGEVLALDASATVPQGAYSGCLKTRDTTPLEPTADEAKYYCPGVGLVLSVDTNSGDREELVSITSP